MLFRYQEHTPTCWRPDLVPAILDWISLLAPSDLTCLKQLRLGSYGDFAALFEKVPTAGGPAREVLVRFDHNYSTVSTDNNIWMGKGPFVLKPHHLAAAADASETPAAS